MLSVFERATRIITPSATAWHRSGDVLAAMVKQEGLELGARLEGICERHPARRILPRSWLCPDYRECP